MSRISLGILALAFVLAIDTSAMAQLFGRRTLGMPLSRRPAPTLEAAGDATTGRRFLRGQRRATDFVGSDRSDVQSFVGSTQASTAGTAIPATVGLRERARPNVNRPRAALAANSMLPLRLTVDFLVPAIPIGDPEIPTTEQRARQALAALGAHSISVSVSDRSATLHGLVASESDRKSAELLLLFEPGIDSVTNDLQVATPTPLPPTPGIR